MTDREPNAGYRTIEVEPVTGALGAEVRGADLAAGPSDAQMHEIRRAFHAHSVLFFRDSPMTPDQQVAFASRWGEPTGERGGRRRRYYRIRQQGAEALLRSYQQLRSLADAVLPELESMIDAREGTP